MLIFRRTIVLTQHLVSSLSLGDCSVHRLRWDSRNLCSEESPKESDDTICPPEDDRLQTSLEVFTLVELFQSIKNERRA